MATVKGDPLAEFRSMQEQMSRLLDKSKNWAAEDEIEDGGWKPAVDIFEEDSRLVLKMELPEITEDQIDISIDGDSLVIRGERELEKGDTNRRYHRIECQYGTFMRTFVLPAPIIREGIEATCSRGVLRVILPKKEREDKDSLALEEK